MNNRMYNYLGLLTTIGTVALVSATPAQAINANIIDNFDETDQSVSDDTANNTAVETTAENLSSDFGTLDRTLKANVTTQGNNADGDLSTTIDASGNEVKVTSADSGVSGIASLIYNDGDGSTFDLSSQSGLAFSIEQSDSSIPLDITIDTQAGTGVLNTSIPIVNPGSPAVLESFNFSNFSNSSSLDLAAVNEINYEFNVPQSADLTLNRTQGTQAVPFEAETSFGLIAVAGFFGYRKFRQYKAKRNNDSVGA